MILRRFICYCGKFQTDTINETVFGKEFVKTSLGKMKTISSHLKQIATASATTAAVTEKVWGEYVSVLWQILAERNTKMSKT